MFNMEEFQAAFSTRYCSVSHFILHGKTIYGVRLRCEEFPLKHNCFIQQCPWPNERPLKTLSLYVQYAWVSSCCFNAIYQWKQLHLTLGNCIQCAFILYRMRVETQVDAISLDIAAILPCTSLYLHPKVTMNSMFNMQEIQAAFSTRNYSVSHCILHAEV